jgi:hypothetical protein
VDEDGFQIVGRKDPFEIWRGTLKESSTDKEQKEQEQLKDGEEPQLLTLENVLIKAEARITSLSYAERDILVEFWTEEILDQARDRLFYSLDESEKNRKLLGMLHDEVG